MWSVGSRLLWVLAVVVASLTAAQPAFALPVRVRGGARLQAQARFLEVAKNAPQVLELRGRLSDDGLAPVVGEWIELTTKSELDLKAAGGCGTQATELEKWGESTRLRVRSGAGGEMCLRWEGPPDKGTLRLSFPGDRYHGAAELEVSFDRAGAQKLATTVRFEPRPSGIDLDKETASFTVVVDLALSTALASREGLEVLLFDGDKQLGSGRTGGDGKVRFSVPTRDFEGPGMGKLRASFAGNPQLEAAHDEHPVTRHTAVTLSLPEPVDETDPGDNADIELALNVKRGTVDSGVVEALIDGSSVTSASASEGRAVLVVPIEPKEAGPITLTVRYLPASPWFREGAPLTIQLAVAPPSPWFRALLALVVAAGAGWVAASWRRARKPPTLGRGAPMLTPGVHVIERSDDGTHWKGTVVDAHEGTLLSGVRVVVRAATLEGDGVVLTTESDGEGRFAFELDKRPEGAELCATSMTHSEEKRALPPAGTLRIALVTRRRAVLRRLVSWARVRGGAYDLQPEPTPGHVRRTADREEVRTWATDVEQVAFGPNEVDEADETRVREREPGPT
jgi:hypothetical protein